jgi:hypothetical protein
VRAVLCRVDLLRQRRPHAGCGRRRDGQQPALDAAPDIAGPQRRRVGSLSQRGPQPVWVSTLEELIDRVL